MNKGTHPITVVMDTKKLIGYSVFIHQLCYGCCCHVSHHFDVPQDVVCHPHAQHATVCPVQLQAAPKQALALY